MELAHEVTWEQMKYINFIIKISDSELTLTRKYEIVASLKNAEELLKERFEEEFAEKATEIDQLLVYLDIDLEAMEHELMEETKTKPKTPSPTK
jgi:hypothetical protein